LLFLNIFLVGQTLRHGPVPRKLEDRMQPAKSPEITEEEIFRGVGNQEYIAHSRAVRDLIRNVIEEQRQTAKEVLTGTVS